MRTDILQLLAAKYGKNNPAELRAGNTIKVHQKIREGEKERIQIFEGLVIAVKHGSGLDGTFTVRKLAANNIGAERIYPLHSPNILKIELVKSAEVSRAKLYYMRDRLGKAARFKNEVRSSQMWEEKGAEAEIEHMHEAEMAEHGHDAEAAEATEAVETPAAEQEAAA
jgi:large subunit ribosomal protein L19